MSSFLVRGKLDLVVVTELSESDARQALARDARVWLKEEPIPKEWRPPIDAFTVEGHIVIGSHYQVKSRMPKGQSATGTEILVRAAVDPWVLVQ